MQLIHRIPEILPNGTRLIWGAKAPFDQ